MFDILQLDKKVIKALNDCAISLDVALLFRHITNEEELNFYLSMLISGNLLPGEFRQLILNNEKERTRKLN